MLTLSPKAEEKVRQFFQEEPEAKGKFLRVAVQPGGCSGFEYAFLFDEKRDQDAEIACTGFSVIVDPKSSELLETSKIDYVEGPTGWGFKIENPKVKSTCGCGKSNQF